MTCTFLILIASSLFAGDQEETVGSSNQPYVDQLIDEEIVEQEFDGIDQAAGMVEWTGMDFLSLTGRVYNSHISGNSTLTEYGTQLIGRKETLDNGSFELQVDGLLTDDRQDQRHEDGRFLLKQNHFVISDNWQMDNAAGHIRSRTPRLISTSYRFHLPSTLLQGLSTTLYSDKTEVSLCAGDIGGLSGTAAREFNTTEGSLQGVSLTHQFNPEWFSGVQFWDTEDARLSDTMDTQEPDGEPIASGVLSGHQSVAAVFQYQAPDGVHRHQLHLLADSRHNAGAWYDTSIKWSRWSHNLGVYYLQPDLLWTDAAIVSDRQGLYYRGNRRSFRWQWTLGTEVASDNIEDDPDRPTYLSTNSFVNGTWRFRRDTLLGAAFNLNTRKDDSDAGEDDNYGYTVKSFVNHRFPIGMTRCQAGWFAEDNQEEENSEFSLLWDQTWKVPFLRRFNTDIEYFTRKNQSDEISMRLAVEKPMTSNFSFSAAAQYIRRLEQDIGPKDAHNANMAINWQMTRNWRVSLFADLNKSAESMDNADTTTESQSLLLSFSYALSGLGRKPIVLGSKTKSIGHGGISGRVFLDENNNGHYDLNEIPLKDIVVILDGRFQTETDADGQFDYWPVTAGDHYVLIGIEDVPLPWGLENEAPQKVFVPVRGQGIADFALIKLNE